MYIAVICIHILVVVYNIIYSILYTRARDQIVQVIEYGCGCLCCLSRNWKRDLKYISISIKLRDRSVGTIWKAIRVYLFDIHKLLLKTPGGNWSKKKKMVYYRDLGENSRAPNKKYTVIISLHDLDIVIIFFLFVSI